MRRNNNYLFFVLLVCSISTGVGANTPTIDRERFISYEVDAKQKDVKLYWKDDKNQIFKRLGNLNKNLADRKVKLLFATNGGMYNENNAPIGLFVQEYKTLIRINKEKGNGNFHLNPNGIFYITNSKIPFICKTENYKPDRNIKYATQSGPMLVIDGKIHSKLPQKSTSLYVRNGVGILPNNNLIFVMSKYVLTLYEFASYFKSLGCKNALYLDGFVSRVYYPEKNYFQTDGNFGVIIGVTER